MRASILPDTPRWPVAPDPGHKPLTTGTAARALRVSTETVRGFVRHGQLSCERTQSGVRLFQSEDVFAWRASARARRSSLRNPSARATASLGSYGCGCSGQANEGRKAVEDPQVKGRAIVRESANDARDN